MSSSKSKKKPFSSFNLQEAYRQLKIEHLETWQILGDSTEPSAEFNTQFQRFQVFDLKRSEEGKKIIIDLVFVEALQQFPSLKAWKGEKLESDSARGAADYLITRNLDYSEAPMLCVAEAKKDDFDQGLAQCLVEMQACQWMNQQIGKTIEVFGIVTNAEGWKFYKLSTQNQVYETELYAFRNLPEILGALNMIFKICDRNLAVG
jgi:hypothetical protein